MSKTATAQAPIEAFLAQHKLPDYDALVQRAGLDPEWFWRSVMDFNGIRFSKPFAKLLDTSKGPEWPRWCVDGEINIATNCLRNAGNAAFAAHPAISWTGEDNARRNISHAELSDMVGRAAAGFGKLGLAKGDVIAIYMPMVPEAIAAFLAIMSIGCVALPLFSGFGADAIAERAGNAEAKAIVTVDVTLRRGKAISLIDVVREAQPRIPSLRHIILCPRAGNPASLPADTTLWSTLLASAPVAPVAMPAEAPAMIVYTSGTTGKPKGTVHSHCGFLTKVALDFGIILDLRAHDRLLWISDLGWLTGPILAVAAPLVGATMVLVEGVPDYPTPDRMWRLVAENKVTFLGVSPTMVRTFIGKDAASPAPHDLSSLRITASTGEPWTPEAWNWFLANVCRGQAALLNYSGGTEIGGGILGSTILHKNLKPCAFGGPIPGMGAAVLTDDGKPVGPGEVGELALTTPSIGLSRGFWNDPEKYLDAYWRKVPGIWMHGDFAAFDTDGNWFIYGRSDDTIKIAGKRTGPAEVEALLLGEGSVVEAAAIGIPDAVKGSALVCLCVLAPGKTQSAELEARLSRAVVAGLGQSFKPKSITFVADLPKTRTGKIMRRVARATWLGEKPGDLSGLVNPEALQSIRDAGAGKA